MSAMTYSNPNPAVRVQTSPASGTIPTSFQFYTASALKYGDLVYISGWNTANGAFAVTKADADGAAVGRAAQYVCMSDVAAAALGNNFNPLDTALTGILDTSGGAVGDPVYLDTTAGGMTLTAPTGNAAVQQVGVVTVVSATIGAVQLLPPAGDGIRSIFGSGNIQGPVTVTSASATALAVGRLGATTPAFTVDASAGTQTAGLKVTGAAANGTVAVVVTDTSGNTNLTVNALGSGTIGIGSVSTGRVTITPVTTITGLLTLTAGITGNFAGTGTLTLGAAAGTNGAVVLTGSTSGTTTIAGNAAPTSWTMTLPGAVAAMAGYQLTDAAANGTCTWAAAGSKRELKNVLGQVNSMAEDALARVKAAKIYDFHYKEGMGTGDVKTTYRGIMADEYPEVMHYEGGIFNPINAFGELVLAVQALTKRVDLALA